jgi:hypothetical protein
MSLRSHVVRLLICTAFISCFAYAGGYHNLRIVAPGPDETVHDNSGNLVVTIAISLPLHAEAGDRLLSCSTARPWRADSGGASG